MKFAAGLAKTHDCKFYVYDMEGTYQCTPTVDDTRKLQGEVYPGGRAVAYALMPGKPGVPPGVPPRVPGKPGGIRL